MCVPIADVYPVLSKPAAAAERNKSINFGGLCVYGLLTDFDHFIFYSFDPVANRFFFDEHILVSIGRKFAFSDMMDGTCFS